MPDPAFSISRDEAIEIDHEYAKKSDRALTKLWGTIGLLLVCVLLHIFHLVPSVILACFVAASTFVMGYQQRAWAELRDKRKTVRDVLSGKVKI